LAKLPEEFAPTGPKLSKFPIRPAPPMRPRLFADEARFARRLAIAAGSSEFIVWFWLFAGTRESPALVLAGLHLLKPFWAWMGTRVSRVALASALFGLPVVMWATGVVGIRFGEGTWFAWLLVVGAALPAVGDLCATTIADSVTVERRAAAFAWLDMGSALGVAGGLVAPGLIRGDPLATVIGSFAVCVSAIFLGFFCIGELRDRGTPRSSWPLGSYLSVLRSPIAWKLTVLAFACAALASVDSLSLWKGLEIVPLGALRAIPAWLRVVAPVAGMVVAARVERFMPNAITLPRAATGFAAIGLYLSLWPVSLFGLGLMIVSIPAAVARGAGEMERPIASSLAWSALFLGAAIGAAV
jgi:hypothetical protein